MTREELIAKWSHSTPGHLEHESMARDIAALLSAERARALEEAATICESNVESLGEAADEIRALSARDGGEK